MDSLTAQAQKGGTPATPPFTLYPFVMVHQRQALAVTTDLLTRFIWFALPGFEPSTLGSVSSNPAFYH